MSIFINMPNEPSVLATLATSPTYSPFWTCQRGQEGITFSGSAAALGTALPSSVQLGFRRMVERPALTKVWEQEAYVLVMLVTDTAATLRAMTSCSQPHSRPIEHGQKKVFL